MPAPIWPRYCRLWHKATIKQWKPGDYSLVQHCNDYCGLGVSLCGINSPRQTCKSATSLQSGGQDSPWTGNMSQVLHEPAAWYRLCWRESPYTHSETDFTCPILGSLNFAIRTCSMNKLIIRNVNNFLQLHLIHSSIDKQLPFSKGHLQNLLVYL